MPTIVKIEADSADHMLLLVEQAQILNKQVPRALTFWDTGSNISMILHNFEKEGWSNWSACSAPTHLLRW